MIVADTDVLVDYLRGASPGAERVAFELATGRFATTCVTAFELLAGGRTSRQSKAVDDLLDALDILPLDMPSVRAAASVRRLLDAEGRGIGMADSLIAGICIASRAMLLTRNRQHFERVEGLALATLSLSDRESPPS
jgi:tRNA(fMet)-specific endonuclease VapC